MTADNNDGTFTAYFTPESIEPYNVELKFGGALVPNGCWTMTVSDDDGANGGKYSECEMLANIC